MTARAAAYALLAVLAFSVLSAGSALACQSPRNATAVAAKTLAAVNARRQSTGLAVLTLNAQLTKAAEIQACYMAKRGNLTHKGAGGRSFKSRLRDVGYGLRWGAENIAKGFNSASEAVAGWQGSRYHRKNMLSRKAREAGVGIRRGADGMLYWSMVFGAPKK